MVTAIASGHRWGVMRCGEASRSGCQMSIWSTSRSSGHHARQVRRFIGRCPTNRCKQQRGQGLEMPSFHFTLIVDGPDLQDDTRIDALFESGCDDAAIGRVGGIQYVDFDREADTLDQAIRSAVTDSENIEGIEVVRIADAGLASMTDIATRFRRTRESVRLLVSGARGPGGFPPRITHPRSRYRLWRRPEVARWFTERVGEELAVPEDDLIVAFSKGLELRHHRRSLTPRDQDRLRDFVEM